MNLLLKIIGSLLAVTIASLFGATIGEAYILMVLLFIYWELEELGELYKKERTHNLPQEENDE